MPPTPQLPLSPNPNLYQTPNLQPADCVEWSPTGTYFMGDCVLRGSVFNQNTQKSEEGEMFFLLALVGDINLNPYQYGFVGLTSDPLLSSLSVNKLTNTGVDFNNDWIQATPYPVGPNPSGAQWVNLTLLSTAIQQWNRARLYSIGDLVYYPDPTVVWRCVTSNPVPPNVPAPGTNGVGFNASNWSLISNPQQYTAFNPNPTIAPAFSIGTGDQAVVTDTPLPPTRPNPL